MNESKIRTQDLDLIVCFECEEAFKNEDEIYAIHAEEFNAYTVDFYTLHRAQEKDDENFLVKRVIRFHNVCFSKIAGKRYMP